MSVIHKPIQILIKERNITDPKEVKKIMDVFYKYKAEMDYFKKEVNEIFRSRDKIDERRRERVNQEFLDLESRIRKEKYGGMISTAFGWVLGVTESWLFTGGKVKLSTYAIPLYPEHYLQDTPFENIFDRVKEEISKISDSLVLRFSLEKQSERVRSAVHSYLVKNFGSKFTFKKNSADIILYDKESEFLYDYYIDAFGLTPEQAKRKVKNHIPDKSKCISGIYNEDTDQIFINLAGLKRIHGRAYKKQALFTIAHEYMHGMGGFSESDSEDRYFEDLFNEIVCENVAHNVLEKMNMLPREEDYSTTLLRSLFWRFENVTGCNLVEAYLDGDIGAINQMLGDLKKQDRPFTP